MNRTFLDAIEHRRSYYALKSESPVSDTTIREIVEHVVRHVPSAFNSQSTRVVVLLGDQHQKLWNLTKEALRAVAPAETFNKTTSKIDKAFASGYGTILYYEDQSVVRALQEQYPLYAENFPIWSDQTNAMHQLTLWTALEDAGFGASLQHYNPIIDEKVAREFDINPDWRLRAQMPFGVPAEEPGEKDFQALDSRIVFLK